MFTGRVAQGGQSHPQLGKIKQLLNSVRKVRNQHQTSVRKVRNYRPFFPQIEKIFCTFQPHQTAL
jgi:hypothetical protein